jgi:hypothetical protein
MTDVNEAKKELAIVKEQARKGFELARELKQMEAAAMFLAQVERLLTQSIGLETLLSELNKTDKMPDPEEVYGPEVETVLSAKPEASV